METVAITETDNVIIENNASTLIITGIMGPPGLSNISQANDVDTADLSDGSVLVYKSDITKWRATKLLDSQILEAGQF